MSYRDDVDAARARTDALGRELADLEARLGDRAELEERARKVRAQLATARAQVEQARARGALPLVDRVVIKTPCKQAWAEMAGDERKRFCGQCQKHVYDISAMTAAEAEALLGGPGPLPCVRLYRRPDGTVMTSDCPEGARRRTRGRLAVAGFAVAAAAGIAGTAAAMMTRDHSKCETQRPEVMGVIAVEPEHVMGGPCLPPDFERARMMEEAARQAEAGVRMGDVAFEPAPPPVKKSARKHRR